VICEPYDDFLHAYPCVELHPRIYNYHRSPSTSTKFSIYGLTSKCICLICGKFGLWCGVGIETREHEGLSMRAFFLLGMMALFVMFD